MKRFLPSILLMLSGVFSLSASTYRHVSYSHPKPFSSTEEKAEENDTLPVRSLEELLIEIVPDAGVPDINLFSMPKIFSVTGIFKDRSVSLSRIPLPPRLFSRSYISGSCRILSSEWYTLLPHQRIIRGISPIFLLSVTP
ncbi:MAG: hypothetical protein K2J03_06680 [Muribaculaceae bacterium]|nr:hypothetical protein [Muribaculaceae bacterium]